MATKTISIDTDAYDRLKVAQKENESFSQTIKRVVPKPIDLDQWYAELDALGPFGKKFSRAVADQVDGRRSPLNGAK